ncbi:MAG: hypothetical protein KKB20_24200 [Proteobacteria bacterium]|nr:hypothetical protein [Pseudomonadota bacterium]
MRTRVIFKIQLWLLLLVVSLSACGIDWEHRTRTLFRPWEGPVSVPADLRPGDVVLRLMESPQSAVLAGLGRDHFSHGGIVFFKGREPWVIDCLGIEPRSAVKIEPWEEFVASKCYLNDFHLSRLGLVPFPYQMDFLYDQQVVHYMVLRCRRPLDPDRLARTLADYMNTPTDYDYDYRLDNDGPVRRMLYCTEFMWRFLKDATGADLDIPFQSRDETTDNIGLLDDMIFKTDVIVRLRERYGDKYIDFMEQIGRKDQKTIADLPPATQIILPQAFLLSPDFQVVDYQPAVQLADDLPVFYGHFQAYWSAVQRWKAAGAITPAALRGLSWKLARDAGRDNPMYYLQDILIRARDHKPDNAG